MEAFLAAVPLVTIAEIGDKTQLLSLVLAARYRKAMPVMLGITLATLLNHAISAWIGQSLGLSLDSIWFSVGVALVFIALGLWMLKPDADEGLSEKLLRFGPFGASFIAFFLAEIGDKTQFATIALASEYQSLWAVTLGTTVGMLIANFPVVLAGEKLMSRLPFDLIRQLASCLFVTFGLVKLAMIWLG